MIFKTSLDRTATGVTVFITLLFILILGVTYYTTTINQGELYPVYSTTLIFLLIVFLAYAFHPTGYKITGDAVFVCRPLSDVQIKRSDIKNVAIIDKTQMSSCVRTFGVGGFFGYYGSFANYTLGGMTWYATRRDKAVLITTINNKKIVVTPNDTDAFIAALKP